MKSTIVINHLKLSYGPMTSYEYDEAKKDKEMWPELEPTSIYIIAKRSLPFFTIKKKIDNGVGGFHLLVKSPDNEKAEIIFDAKENSNFFPNGIGCMDLFTNQYKQVMKETDPFHAFSLFNHKLDFVMRLNFDRLIQLYHNGIINIHIIGDITPFITYEVLYVGQCAGEHFFKRFKGHEALQTILIKEQIAPRDYNISNDILILPFTVHSETIYSFGNGASNEETDTFVNLCMGKPIIPKENISLDCEKALVHAMNPQYNNVRFCKYPKSKDGLIQFDLDCFSYQIDENLILLYDKGEKIYGQTEKCQSIIRILNNDTLEIQTFPVEKR